MKVKKMPKTPLLSLIIPAYKQEKTIIQDVNHVREVMDKLPYRYEIIIVIDGFLDKTYLHAKKLQSPQVKVIGYQSNKGKGYAVRFGMSQAKGDLVAFLDSGMDINPNGISMLLEHFQWYNADIIVGSKLHPVSKVQYPLTRHMLSWGYRTLVKILFGLSIRDTQVGIKVFRKQVLQDVLPRLLIKTYAFDIELLAVAYALGYRRIYEAPVELDFTGASSITSKTLWKTILHMLWDTCAVYYRLKIRHYYQKNKRPSKFDPELQYRVNLP